MKSEIDYDNFTKYKTTFGISEKSTVNLLFHQDLMT